jgi:hypothetical protein
MPTEWRRGGNYADRRAAGACSLLFSQAVLADASVATTKDI